VFVVGYAGDWRRAAAVLFERHSLSGHPAPRREAREDVAGVLTSRASGGGGGPGAGTAEAAAGYLQAVEAFGGGNTSGPIPVAAAHGRRQDFEVETFVAHTLKGEGFDASEDGTGRGTPIVPVAYRTTGNDGVYETGDAVGALTQSTDPNAQIIAFSAKDHGADAMSDLSPTLRAGGHAGSHANAGVMPAVAFAQNTRDEVREMPYVGALAAEPGMKQTSYVRQSSAVRRLTPRECERLQGLPDDYTLIPWRKGVAPDGPRYKALGNSMAVPVMTWIGRRIAAVEAITQHQREAA
jgi:DNA (cytosine-5)-methyltransferase 1